MEKVRLQIILRNTLNCSRRKAEQLISQSRVKLNGDIAQLGAKADPNVDKILLDSKPIKPTLTIKKVYLKLYKPRGYITSLSDDKGRKCVMDLINDKRLKLYPVGRLDYNSEGLLLITNDGYFANNIINSNKNIPKTYIATVSPKVKTGDLDALSRGVTIDGIKLKPAKFKLLQSFENKSLIKVTVYEGKNRQIRKMFDKYGYSTLRLKRISVGGIKLANLKPGEYTYLTQKEILPFLD